VCETTGKSLQAIKAEYKKLGDLGLVAQASGSTVRTLKPPKPLTIRGVFEVLHQIATESGNQVRCADCFGIFERETNDVGMC